MNDEDSEQVEKDMGFGSKATGFDEGGDIFESETTKLKEYAPRNTDREYENTDPTRKAFKKEFGDEMDIDWESDYYSGMSESLLKAAVAAKKANPTALVTITEGKDGAYDLNLETTPETETFSIGGQDQKLPIGGFLSQSIKDADRVAKNDDFNNKDSAEAKVTVVAPDGKETIAILADLVNAGRRILQTREGSNFNQGGPTQSAAAAFSAIMSELQLSNYDVRDQATGDSLLSQDLLTDEVIKEAGGVIMDIDDVAALGDDAMSPWLTASGQIVGTGQDHLAFASDALEVLGLEVVGEYADFMKKTGAIRMGAWRESTNRRPTPADPFAVSLHTYEGQELTKAQIETLFKLNRKAASTNGNQKATLLFGATDSFTNPEYKAMDLTEFVLSQRQAQKSKEETKLSSLRAGGTKQSPLTLKEVLSPEQESTPIKFKVSGTRSADDSFDAGGRFSYEYESRKLAEDAKTALEGNGATGVEITDDRDTYYGGMNERPEQRAGLTAEEQADEDARSFLGDRPLSGLNIEAGPVENRGYSSAKPKSKGGRNPMNATYPAGSIGRLASQVRVRLGQKAQATKACLYTWCERTGANVRG